MAKSAYETAQETLKGVQDTLKSSGRSDLVTPSGITTSDEATNRAKTANSTLDSISKKVKSQYTTTDGQRVTLYTDGTKKYSDSKTSGGSSKAEDSGGGDASNPFAAFYSQISGLQDKLSQAKEAEAAAKTAKDEQDLQVKLKGMDSASEAGAQGEADLNAAGNAINGTDDSSGIEDPMIKMYTDTFMNKVSVINDQAQTLEQYRSQFNEYTQQDIDSIVRTAARSVKKQEAENERTKRAMEFAGVLGGRAQFSPIIEESIISDVIREGLDEIEVINEKKNSAIREARKAEADFNIDIFEQQAELAKEYYDQIETTFSNMNTRVRQVEQDERERLTFRQQQEERNSLILAEQLVDATPEKIAETAAANGLDVGLLTKAVNDAKYEQANREFTEKDQALTLEQKRASIANSWKSYNDNGDDEVEIEIPKDVEQGLRSVAQLSQGDREDIWMDIQDFGLNQDAVAFWLEDRAFSKSQVKGIIKAHEQSQRNKGIDASGEESLLPTETEQALFEYVDKYETTAYKKASEELTDIVSKRKYATTKKDEPKIRGKYDGPGGSIISSTETFFKEK